LPQNWSLDDNIPLLIADAILKYAPIEHVIKWRAAHDHRSDLTHQTVVIAICEIDRLDGRYNTVSHFVVLNKRKGCVDVADGHGFNRTQNNALVTGLRSPGRQDDL
jgi:hypothetical protein